ncbi:MAG: helix-turn-helix domain-containing protein [Acidobacteriota bacterium]
MLTAVQQTPTSLLYLGDYEAAVTALGSDWPGAGIKPSRNGRDDASYARLLMTCGVLAIKLGNIQQASFQAASKDMLTQAARLSPERAARQEAWMWLGVVYILCGEYHEAMALAETLLADDTNVTVVFGSTLIRAIGETCLKRYDKALASLASVEMLLPAVPVLDRGKFYLNRGIAYRNVPDSQKAIDNYNLAADLFEEVSSLRWEAAATNNLAGVYTDLEQYVRAHGFVERAISLFQKLKDKAHEAKAWDQSARIYLKEEDFVWAERNAGTAVALLSQGDNQTWLAEALITHGIALGQIGFQRSTVQLAEAARICEEVGSMEQAEEARRELWKAARHARKMAGALGESVRPLERIVIGGVLEKHGGRVTPAAFELGLRRVALDRKIKQLGLTRSPKRKSPRKVRH